MTRPVLVMSWQVPAARFLQTLRRADFDLFHGSLAAPDPLLPGVLVLHAWRGTY